RGKQHDAQDPAQAASQAPGLSGDGEDQAKNALHTFPKFGEESSHRRPRLSPLAGPRSSRRIQPRLQLEKRTNIAKGISTPAATPARIKARRSFSRARRGALLGSGSSAWGPGNSCDWVRVIWAL